MPEALKIYDGIVIGGGLAGGALATIMAQAGKEILLFEKEVTPHHKVCGEFLGQKALEYLKRLDIDPQNLGGHKIHSVRLIDGGKSVTRKLPSPGWSLSRFVLDEALLDRAKEAGAIIKRGQIIRDFSRKPNFFEVQISKQPVKRARNIFLATGKHDLRNWKRKGFHADTTDFLAFKMHYSLAPDQLQELSGHTEIILFNGGYAGLQPIENNQANLCFLIKKAIFAKCGKDWGKLLKWFKEQSPHLDRRLNGSQALWENPAAIYQIPYGYVYSSPAQPGLFRLGDQNAVIHSFAGHGMAMALQSAFTAADVYLGEGDSTQYHSMVQSAVSAPVKNAQRLAKLVMNPYTRKIILPIVQTFPAILEKAYYSTRS